MPVEGYRVRVKLSKFYIVRGPTRPGPIFSVPDWPPVRAPAPASACPQWGPVTVELPLPLPFSYLMAQMLVVQQAVQMAEDEQVEHPADALDAMRERFLLPGVAAPFGWVTRLRTFGKRVQNTTTSLGGSTGGGSATPGTGPAGGQPYKQSSRLELPSSTAELQGPSNHRGAMAAGPSPHNRQAPGRVGSCTAI
ncbi:predicted protein [Histoplasma mississippiense (nom. inval.)]|uniref:predicted protein n=1 Tax=Ajellomyces capsulatus (strain NAm1 / WU24) TaxID=2059318 RepID=UPI000157D63C|nr:predicted protein [Histoplasma mississippiense (nom. inval.)]EDN06559.1 predicted protein [Histoplasma mississippiense (nom. inval.)]